MTRSGGDGDAGRVAVQLQRAAACNPGDKRPVAVRIGRSVQNPGFPIVDVQFLESVSEVNTRLAAVLIGAGYGNIAVGRGNGILVGNFAFLATGDGFARIGIHQVQKSCIRDVSGLYHQQGVHIDSAVQSQFLKIAVQEAWLGSYVVQTVFQTGNGQRGCRRDVKTAGDGELVFQPGGITVHLDGKRSSGQMQLADGEVFRDGEFGASSKPQGCGAEYGLSRGIRTEPGIGQGDGSGKSGQRIREGYDASGLDVQCA